MFLVQSKTRCKANERGKRAGRLALYDDIKKQGIRVRIEERPFGTFKLHFKLHAAYVSVCVYY